MSRCAARVGATIEGGLELVAAAVAEALASELAAEPHGPIDVRAYYAPEHAAEAMAVIGVTDNSPARRFIADHPSDGILVVAMAEVEQ